MLRVFLVFLSLRLSFSLPAALACPSLCSLIAWCAPWSTRGNSALRFGCRQVPSPQSAWTAHRACLQLIDADLYDGTAGWGGEVLFRLAPLSSFPLILFCLALCTAIACNCTRGVLALCVQYFVDASALRRSLERCRRAQRAGCRRDGRKHGGNCTETGSFSHRPPRSPSRGEHAACRRTVPSSCAGGGGKTRPRKRQM